MEPPLRCQRYIDMSKIQKINTPQSSIEVEMMEVDDQMYSTSGVGVIAIHARKSFKLLCCSSCSWFCPSHAIFTSGMAIWCSCLVLFPSKILHNHPKLSFDILVRNNLGISCTTKQKIGLNESNYHNNGFLNIHIFHK